MLWKPERSPRRDHYDTPHYWICGSFVSFRYTTGINHLPQWSPTGIACPRLAVAPSLAHVIHLISCAVITVVHTPRYRGCA